MLRGDDGRIPVLDPSATRTKFIPMAIGSRDALQMIAEVDLGWWSIETVGR